MTDWTLTGGNGKMQIKYWTLIYWYVSVSVWLPHAMALRWCRSATHVYVRAVPTQWRIWKSGVQSSCQADILIFQSSFSVRHFPVLQSNNSLATRSTFCATNLPRVVTEAKPVTSWSQVRRPSYYSTCHRQWLRQHIPVILNNLNRHHHSAFSVIASQQYGMPQRRHNFELPTRTNHLTNCYFIQRMLYFNCYWLVIFYFFFNQLFQRVAFFEPRNKASVYQRTILWHTSDSQPLYMSKS